MNRYLLPIVLVFGAAAGRCSISVSDPDRLPMARGFKQKEFMQLEMDYNEALRGASLRSCQEAIVGKADSTLFRVLHLAVFMHARELPGAQDFCVKHNLIAFAIPKANVIALCPSYFTLPDTERTLTIIHESIHLLGLSHKDVKEFDVVIWKKCLLPLRMQGKDDVLTPKD